MVTGDRAHSLHGILLHAGQNAERSFRISAFSLRDVRHGPGCLSNRFASQETDGRFDPRVTSMIAPIARWIRKRGLRCARDERRGNQQS